VVARLPSKCEALSLNPNINNNKKIKMSFALFASVLSRKELLSISTQLWCCHAIRTNATCTCAYWSSKNFPVLISNIVTHRTHRNQSSLGSSIVVKGVLRPLKGS
jgi:hypothetical protein